MTRVSYINIWEELHIDRNRFYESLVKIGSEFLFLETVALIYEIAASL